MASNQAVEIDSTNLRGRAGAKKGNRMDRVERVARAMCKADGEDPDHMRETGKESDVEQKWNWTNYERQARLFLAALDAVEE
jgi:hypothetical protein